MSASLTDAATLGVLRSASVMKPDVVLVLVVVALLVVLVAPPLIH
jgi:hypothetical protein